MSLRARILVFLVVLVAVSMLPPKAPWPMVTACGLYLALVFPALAPPKREGAHPEMAPPPSWWSREQWLAAMRAVRECRCDPYDCGPYGHDEDCPAGVLSQGQYNAVKDTVRDAR